MLDSIPSFARLVGELSKFPGVGRKTAARMAFFLLRQPAVEAEALADAVRELKARIRFCSRCFHMTESDPCAICSDPTRDEQLLCVVEQPQDLLAIERSRQTHLCSFTRASIACPCGRRQLALPTQRAEHGIVEGDRTFHVVRAECAVSDHLRILVSE